MLMDKIDAIINNLESLRMNDKILTITTQIPITKQFEMNLYFQKDRDLYVKEHILHKIFLPFYPNTLVLWDWKIMEEEYCKDHLLVSFQISKDEYIDFIYDRFTKILF